VAGGPADARQVVVSDLNFSDFPVSRIWRGRNYPESRIFILGESWYGEYLGDLNYDDGYIAAYVEGRQVDRMYSKMANAVGMSKATFWHSVAFTNFVQCVGPTRQSRPTPAMYSAAAPRLKAILSDISPAAVWVLGIEQSALSIPIIQAAPSLPPFSSMIEFCRRYGFKSESSRRGHSPRAVKTSSRCFSRSKHCSATSCAKREQRRRSVAY